MKTTIKITNAKRIIVSPCMKAGGVILETVQGLNYTSAEPWHLTADQVGALIVGLECAYRATQTDEFWASRGQAGLVGDGVAA
jgi:hypothetical protein